MAQTIQWFCIDWDIECDPPLNWINSSHLTVFDPSFMIPVAASLVSTHSSVVNIPKLIECNYAGLAVMALSSNCATTRQAGYFILDHLYPLVQAADFPDKNQVLLVLESLANVLPNRSMEVFPQLSGIFALFVAQSLMVMLKPELDVYPSINRFYLQKEIVNSQDIPLFYDLFYSESDDAKKERLWMLRLLVCGLKGQLDIELFQKRRVVPILCGFYASPLSDGVSKKLVLEVILLLSLFL